MNSNFWFNAIGKWCRDLYWSIAVGVERQFLFNRAKAYLVMSLSRGIGPLYVMVPSNFFSSNSPTAFTHVNYEASIADTCICWSLIIIYDRFAYYYWVDGVAVFTLTALFRDNQNCSSVQCERKSNSGILFLINIYPSKNCWIFFPISMMRPFPFISKYKGHNILNHYHVVISFPICLFIADENICKISPTSDVGIKHAQYEIRDKIKKKHRWLNSDGFTISGNHRFWRKSVVVVGNYINKNSIQ